MSTMPTSRDYRRIERAIQFLAAQRARQPSLDELAAELALSPHHLQRTFKRFAGVSPKRFLQHMSATHARTCLVDARTVLDTTYEVGLSSPGRLHDLLVQVEAVTPGEMRTGGKGLTIRHGTHDTPFGAARLALSERGIVGLTFDPATDADIVRRRFPYAEHIDDPRRTAPTMRRIFARAPDDTRPLPLLLKGTNLQLQVWRALLRIPSGCVVSYGSLAAALDRPSAARGVANAVGANAIGWLIPCHRVLRRSGALGGYRWGTTRKQALLGQELSQARGVSAR